MKSMFSEDNTLDRSIIPDNNNMKMKELHTRRTCLILMNSNSASVKWELKYLTQKFIMNIKEKWNIL